MRLSEYLALYLVMYVLRVRDGGGACVASESDAKTREDPNASVYDLVMDPRYGTLSDD